MPVQEKGPLSASERLVRFELVENHEDDSAEPIECPRCHQQTPTLLGYDSDGMRSTMPDFYGTNCSCGMSIDISKWHFECRIKIAEEDIPEEEIRLSCWTKNETYLVWEGSVESTESFVNFQAVGWDYSGYATDCTAHVTETYLITHLLGEPAKRTSYRCVLPFDITVERAKKLALFI